MEAKNLSFSRKHIGKLIEFLENPEVESLRKQNCFAQDFYDKLKKTKKLENLNGEEIFIEIEAEELLIFLQNPSVRVAMNNDYWAYAFNYRLLKILC